MYKTTYRKAAAAPKVREEQKSNFMEKLDQWSEKVVINPLISLGLMQQEAGNEWVEEEHDAELTAIKRSIREKVLESYRNGQQAGPRPTVKQGRR
jgi:hypothetical protein